MNSVLGLLAFFFFFPVFVSISLSVSCRTVILLNVLCNLEGLLNITITFLSTAFIWPYIKAVVTIAGFSRWLLSSSISEINFQSENAIHFIWGAVSLVDCN